MTCLACQPTPAEIAKVNRDRWLGSRNRKVETRSRAMARQVERQLRRIALIEFQPALDEVFASVLLEQRAARQISKAPNYSEVERELLELFRRNGLQQLFDGGKESASAVGNRSWVIRPEVLTDFLAQKENKVVLLIDETRQQVHQSINRIVGDALNETPRPTAKEVGRRIARQWFGPPSATPPGRGTQEEERVTADWRRRDVGGPAPDDREYLFSFRRAQHIANDELAEAQSLGIVEGFADSGVRKVKWLAYGNDGRSGKRRHYLMNRHKAIPVEYIKGGDSSLWFELPSGVRTPRPQWGGLPIREKAWCRCTLRPV